MIYPPLSTTNIQESDHANKIFNLTNSQQELSSDSNLLIRNKLQKCAMVLTPIKQLVVAIASVCTAPIQL